MVSSIVKHPPRFAESKDLDVSSGGWVEAEMFLPPLGFDVANVKCKTGYIGVVNLDFSTDGELLGLGECVIGVFMSFCRRTKLDSSK